MSSRRSGGASTSWELQLGTAGLLGGTTAYPQLAPAAAPLRAAPEPRPSDGKVTWLLLTWSLVATVLWVYQFTLAATSSDPSTNPLLFARTTQTACMERKWHGGSPLDTFKGSCYCGSDTYCMCTPSLAIDAIIEVWNYNKDKEKETTVASAGATGGGKGADAGENTSSSRGKRGVGGPSASGEGGGGGSSVKAATGGAGAGQEEGRPERTRKGPPGARRHGSGGGGHGNAFAAGGRVLTAVDTSTSTSTGTGVLRSLWALASSSSSSTSTASSSNAETGGSKGTAAVAAASTAAAAVAAALPPVPTTTTRTGAGQSVNSADVAVVLVYRGAPPAGYAIPGGFVEVGESAETATVREVKEETNLDLVALEQFKVFSDPKRDARRHTVSVVFRCVAKTVTGVLKKGSDAKQVRVVPLKDALSLPLAFDHRQIIAEYIVRYHPSLAGAAHQALAAAATSPQTQGAAAGNGHGNAAAAVGGKE